MSPYLRDIHDFMHRRSVSLTEREIIQHFSRPTCAQLDVMLEQSPHFRCRKQGRSKVWTAVEPVPSHPTSETLGEGLPRVSSVWRLAA